jgi:hypothetical protein
VFTPAKPICPADEPDAAEVLFLGSPYAVCMEQQPRRWFVVLSLASFRARPDGSPQNIKAERRGSTPAVCHRAAEVRGSSRMLHSRRRSGSILTFGVLLLLFPGRASQAAGPERIISPNKDQQRIQDIVDSFMTRLTLHHKVAVSVVPRNPLMFSVEFDDVDTGFRLTVEENFISELTQEELEAAVAHELGHVWIFTHHPFLQTEALANEIAQRLVPRTSLVQVYEKVFKRQGARGDLGRFVED